MLDIDKTGYRVVEIAMSAFQRCLLVKNRQAGRRRIVLLKYSLPELRSLLRRRRCSLSLYYASIRRAKQLWAALEILPLPSS